MMMGNMMTATSTMRMWIWIKLMALSIKGRAKIQIMPQVSLKMVLMSQVHQSEAQAIETIIQPNDIK